MSDQVKSNPEFHRIMSKHEYETFTFPKEILYDKNLSGNAMKLLLTILDYGKRPNWVLRQTHLMRATGFKRTVYDSAIECLEEAGYVKRNRSTKGGKYCPYEYTYCAFPILREEIKEKIPVQVFRSGKSAAENQHYTSSNSSYVLEDTTNQEQEKLVSGSSEKLKELEEVKNISDSQKATLYKKFTHQQILSALKAVDLKKADSPFALLFKAIENNYQPNENQSPKNRESYEVYEKAVQFIAKVSTNISLGIDDKCAYIYLGMASTAFELNDPEFKQKFSDAINNSLKK